ncbi:PorV/PorQ family protein [bacterium]|nr:PorV/PorQ family protein [bacterium]
MRTSSLILAVLVTVLLTVPIAQAQFVSNVSKVGTTAATFLEVGIGARATSMGGAFVAVANDASAIYWNPAGMARLPYSETMFVHAEWLADISFDNVSGVIPVGNNMALGAFVTTVSMDEMAVRTVDLPDGTGEFFDAGDMAFGASFAAMLTDKLSIGVTGKYVRQYIWHMDASAVALDMGLLFDTPFDKLKLGMSISNWGSDMQMTGRDTRIYYDTDPNNPGNNDKIQGNLETETWSLPLTFRAGLSYPWDIGTEYKLIAAIDAVHPNNNYEYVNLGAELNMRNWAYLRGGYKTLFLDDSEQGMTLGAGLRYRMHSNVAFIADITYADFGRLENVFRYSLGVQF